MHSRQLHRR